jgi:2'-5' RNA ligase
MSEPLRLFVAVTLPDEVRGRLVRSQETLRAAQADVSWVKPENLHLTVKFLGDTDRRALARIRPALEAVGRQLVPFSLALCGLGAFGGRVPRVVWAGVSEGAAPLTDLAERVDAALGRVGVPKEKRGFSAHATLGRVRSARNADALTAAVGAAGAEAFGGVAVRDFVLMQSELNPQGSVYTVLERFTLGEEASAG